MLLRRSNYIYNKKKKNRKQLAFEQNLFILKIVAPPSRNSQTRVRFSFPRNTPWNFEFCCIRNFNYTHIILYYYRALTSSYNITCYLPIPIYNVYYTYTILVYRIWGICIFEFSSNIVFLSDVTTLSIKNKNNLIANNIIFLLFCIRVVGFIYSYVRRVWWWT